MFNFNKLNEFANFFFSGGPEPDKPKRRGRKRAADTAAPPQVREVIHQVKQEKKAKVDSAPRAKTTHKKQKNATVSQISRQNKQDGEQSWETDLNEKPAFEEEQSSVEERVRKIVDVPKVKESVFLPFRQANMDKTRRNMLFVNPGEDAINLARLALQKNWDLPKWATPFENNLALDKSGQRLTFDGQIMATQDEKRVAVKRLYFDPKKPSTILPIVDVLRADWPNVTKKDVRDILRSLETYQLNYGRRKPPDVLGKMNLANPGVIAMDMFFPSKNLGWRKINVLACIDCWSRFCWCYALERKDKKSTGLAMTNFLQRFASRGHMPRRILCDKGTDLAPAATVIERYRLAKDKNNPMVFHSATGTPVNIIEAFNAQVQRRLQVFRTSGITDDVSTIIDDICEQLNNQKRPARGNMTPLQLLTLDQAQRKEVNTKNRVSRDYVSEVPGLKPIFVGDKVRLLKMTRKEQAAPKMGFKGFAPKWSNEIYTVIKMTPIRKNKDVFRYYIGRGQSFFRHELLLIPRRLDQSIIKDYVSHKENVIAPEEAEWEADYQEGAYDSDDSRA